MTKWILENPLPAAILWCALILFLYMLAAKKEAEIYNRFCGTEYTGLEYKTLEDQLEVCSDE